MNDDAHSVAVRKVKAKEFKALQAAHHGDGGKSKKGKCRTKGRIEKKVKATICKAQEDTVAAATTVATATTPQTPRANKSAPPVWQVCVQPQNCLVNRFGGAASLADSAITPFGMQHHGLPQAYHDECLISHPSSFH